jgi:hypothetical protein
VRETVIGREPFDLMVEGWTLSSESLVLRRSIKDGVIVPPPEFSGWQFIDASKPWISNIDRFLWNDGR